MPFRLTAPSPDTSRSVINIPAARPLSSESSSTSTAPAEPLRIGGRSVVMIAGPCAVEGRSMLFSVAARIRAAGAAMLRGGAFKPRTSPYAFQGLGAVALLFLAEVRKETGLPIATEVLDPRHVEFVADYADVLQVGARNMQNYPLLAEVGRAGRPVILKRGFVATLDELLLAAEHVMAAGNPDVILCERGIRTAGQSSRFTLDVAAVPQLKAETHLPVIVDPSHAAGRADVVPSLAAAAVAAGADGLLVEVHPDPASARSDGPQSLSPEQFDEVMRTIGTVAHAIGRDLARPTGVVGQADPLEVLARLREDIEGIDRQIIQLISERVAVAKHAGEAKRAAGVPVVDPLQEAEVLERARRMAIASGLPYREVRALLRGIIAVSRNAQLNDLGSFDLRDDR